jgi:molybdenum cofactor guanylyltransferase
VRDPGDSSSAQDPSHPIGVVLAGGRGERIGGAKATVELRGKPLVCYPLEALQSVLEDVVVLAKCDTKLPSLPGVTVWIEPDASQHPLVGISHAIALAAGRPVVICAADLPFVTPAAVRLIAEADSRGAPAVIASSGGLTQPLLGRYGPEVPGMLGGATRLTELRLQPAIAALGPVIVELGDPDALFNVNTPDDLLQAAAMLDSRYPNVKS